VFSRFADDNDTHNFPLRSFVNTACETVSLHQSSVSYRSRVLIYSLTQYLAEHLVMTAAIVPSLAPSLSFHSDPSVEARKRRREIMASQRSIPVTSTPVSPPEPVVSAYVASDTATVSAPRKKRKVSEEDTKKPQMKYDPEVPMTKEAAATWRREQRRKRNRESAAASRQRQRDRIAELESERDGWKVQYEAVMTKIRDLEATSGAEPFQVEIRCLSPVRSKTPEPQEAPSTVTPRASPTSSTDIEFLSFVKQESQDEHVLLPSHQPLLPTKMISRPA
jgi:hypothetical protein